MSVGEERVIALSRAKLALTTAGALLMAAAGVWFFVASDDGSLVTTLGRFVPPWVVHALGLAAALFGAAGAVYGVRKSLIAIPFVDIRREAPCERQLVRRSTIRG